MKTMTVKSFTRADKRAALDAIQDMLRDGLISYKTSLSMKERWL